MKWKLTHKHQHDIIENEGGKTLSYNANLGIQIIEEDGYAFKDLNQSGKLEPFEDWRLPLTQRIADFTKRFGMWQEEDQLYYHKGMITIPLEVYQQLRAYGDLAVQELWEETTSEDINYLKENYLLAILLLMFDNDWDTGKEDYLLQLIIQSMDLGVLENIMYSIWEAVSRYIQSHPLRRLHVSPI